MDSSYLSDLKGSQEDKVSESLDLLAPQKPNSPESSKAEILIRNFNSQNENYKDPNLIAQIAIYLKILLESALPIIQLLTTSLYTLLGFLFLSTSAKPELGASLGLYMSIYNFFCKMVAIAIAEQTGIVASTMYGSKEYSRMKQSLLYGLIISSLFLFFYTLPIYFFSALLTSLIGIEDKVSDLTNQLLLLSIPVAVATAYGEQVKAYCYSQEIEECFGWINIILFIATAPLMWFLMVH